MPFARIT